MFYLIDPIPGLEDRSLCRIRVCGRLTILPVCPPKA